MGRLPTLTRDGLAPAGQEVWDRIAAVRDGVRGPYEVLIRVPALADRVRALEDYFRFDAALPDAERELIILATGRELGARFAWGVHEPRARQVGTRPEAIEAVRDDGPLDGLTARERLLVEMVRALLRERALSDDLYARALADLGERQLVEVVALTGHYSLIGLLLNGFAVPPREGSPGF
jgi:4-carboxymuconolactone decarboxylase